MNDALWWTDKDGTMHEKCKLVFVSTGELINFDPGDHEEMGWFRCSWALFCNDCGDVWERILLINSKNQQQAFEVIPCACERHIDHWHVPGSRLVGRLDGLLPLLPEGVLRREFEAHIKYAEREIALDNTNTAAGMVPDGHQGSLGGSDWNGQDLRNRGTG